MVNQALPYNDRSLLENGTYRHVDTTDFSPNVIKRYSLTNESDTHYDLILSSIRKFLNDNPPLCPTFSMETLQEKIKGKYCLIVNGLTVNLLKDHEEEEKAEYKDTFFSKKLLKHPIKCSRGHLLEKKKFSFWQTKYPNTCPAGADHGIISLEVDKELEYKLSIYAMEQLRQKHQVSPYITTLGTVAKLIVKLAGKSICLKICKQLIANSGRTAALTVAKKIPLLGAVIGLGLGIYRLSQGEFLEATGEALSGILGCFPGFGTFASLSIDGMLIARDIDKALNPDLTASYLVLGIDPTKNPNPSKEEVNSAFRRITDHYHPDKLRPYGAALVKMGTNICINAEANKNLIYKTKGWTLDDPTPSNPIPPSSPIPPSPPSSPTHPSNPIPPDGISSLFTESLSRLGINNPNPTQEEVDKAFDQVQKEVNEFLKTTGKEFIAPFLTEFADARDFIYQKKRWAVKTA